MKISPVKNYINQIFTSKHVNVRDADDLMRYTQNNFPAFHPSYADLFYKSLQRDCFEKAYYRDKFLDGIATRFVENVRRPTNIVEDTSKPQFAYLFLLDSIKEFKMANCKEASSLMLSALYANGFYRSQIVNLAFDYTVTDKKTNEIVFQNNHYIDHCFVLTTMNNDDRKSENDAIVVDSWLNYCADSKDAKAKYKELFAKDMYREIYADLYGFKINMNDVNINISPYYCYATDYDENTAKQIAETVLLKYPNLLYNKSFKNPSNVIPSFFTDDKSSENP